MCCVTYHRYVHCGCTASIIIEIACKGLRHDPNTETYYCASRSGAATVVAPYEGLPCCPDCAATKFQEIRARFDHVDGEIRDMAEQNLITKKQFCWMLGKNREERDLRIDLMSRPYRRTLRDALEYSV